MTMRHYRVWMGSDSYASVFARNVKQAIRQAGNAYRGLGRRRTAPIRVECNRNGEFVTVAAR